MNSLFVFFNQICKKSAKSRLSRVKIGGFLNRRPPHSEFEGTKPSKGMCINRNTTYEPLSVQFGPKLRLVGWPRTRKKGGRRKSQNRYISPSCGSAISQPIWIKYNEFVDLTDFITRAKFGFEIFICFSRLRGRKTHFSYRKQMSYITVPCATALAWDEKVNKLATLTTCVTAPYFMMPGWRW